MSPGPPGWFSCHGGKQLLVYFASLTTEKVVKIPIYYSKISHARRSGFDTTDAQCTV